MQPELFSSGSESNSSVSVVHCKKSEYNIYIGRPSKWGNPFSHKPGTLATYKVETRQQAIAAYKQWITTGAGKHLLNDLHELKGKVVLGFRVKKLKKWKDTA